MTGESVIPISGRNHSSEETARMPRLNIKEIPSQWVVNAAYLFKNIGLTGTVAIFLMVGTYQGVSYAGPKWGDPMFKALTTVAETNKTLVENDKRVTAYMATLTELLTSVDKRLQNLERNRE